MKRNITKSLFSTTTALVLCAVLMISAHAASASCAPVNFNHEGSSFTAYNTVTTNTVLKYAYASAQVTCNNGTKPTAYFEIIVLLKNGNGSTVRNNSGTNNSAKKTYSLSTSNYSTSGTYIAEGLAGVYMSTGGYSYYFLPGSPKLSF